jgi:hypothetical protein
MYFRSLKLYDMRRFCILLILAINFNTTINSQIDQMWKVWRKVWRIYLEVWQFKLYIYNTYNQPLS